MSNSQEKNGKSAISRFTPRLIYIKILILACLIVLSMITLKPIQTALSGTISSIRTNFIGKLEMATGMEIRYSSIRPAFFSSFDIRNIKFFKNDNEVLSITRARFHFSILELLINRNISFNAIQIDRPVIRIDMERDRDIFDNLRNLSASKESNKDFLGQIKKFLPQKADYRIRSGFASVSSSGSFYKIENVNLNVRGDADALFIYTKFVAELRFAGLFDRVIVLKTGMDITGNYLTKSREIMAQAAFLDLICSQENEKNRGGSSFRQVVFQNADSGTLFTMKPFTTAFFFDGISLGFTPPQNTGKGDYYIHLNTQTRRIIAELTFNNFIPASYVTLQGLRNYAGDLLNRETSGAVSFSYENNGELDYSVSLQSGDLTRTWQDNGQITDAFLINAAGNQEHVFVNDFCLNTSANSFFRGIVNFSGRIGFFPISPVGTVSVEHLTFTGKENVTGIFDISTVGKNITVTGDKFSIGSFLLKKFEMFFYPSQNDMAVSVSALPDGDGALYFDAVYYKTPRQLETSFVFDSFSLYNLTEIFRPFIDLNIPTASYVFTRNTLLNGEFFFSSDFSNIAYNAPRMTLNNDGIIGLLSVSGTDKNISLSEGIFYFGENELFVSADANFTNPADIDFLVKANYLDVAWNIKGQILDKKSFIVDDPAGLHAYGSVSNSGAVSGYIEGVDFPIPANVYPAFMNFYIALRYNSKDFWSVDIDNFSIRDLYTHNGRVNLSMKGVADQSGADFNNILYSDNIGNLFGNADFSWDPDFSNVKFIFNMTDGYANGEFCFFRGLLADKIFDINGSLTNMRIDRFVRGGPGVMLASADTNISFNTINSFNVKVDVSSFYARMRTNTVQASMEMLFSDNNLLINNLNFNYAQIKTSFPVFQVNIDEGIGKVTAAFEGYAGERRLNGNMNLNTNFKPIDSWLDINKALGQLAGALVFENFIFGDLFQDRVLFTFAADEEFISFSGGVKDMIKMEMDRKGNFYLGLSDPLPVRGAFSGVYNKGSMDAYCNDYFIDMASLWKLAAYSVDDFKIAGGYITGKMNLKGPVWNPEFYGNGTGTSLRFNVPNFVSEDIRPVPFNILAQGYEMTFGPVVTASGSGGGTVSGWFRFEYWVPRNIGLDISIPRATPIPYGIDIAGFNADGIASGNLDLDLNSNDRLMQIKGSLFMNNTEMYVNREGILSNLDRDRGDKYNTVVNISITSGSMVEFFWPNKNSPILRANPEMGTVFKISSDTQSGQYSLVSDVKVRSGELFYFDRNFYIRQGSLVFRENETQFNPRISARAEIKDRADSGPVTISMIIENQPLLTFEPRFESFPGLTQLEIYTILGQNLHNIDRGDEAQRFLLASSTDVIAQMMSSSGALSQVLFFRQIERNVRKFLNLDMLSIRTRFFQNAVISSSSAMFGLVPVDRISRVGNYFDNTTVFIGKYIGQDMFVQGNIILKFDENSAAFGGLRLEPDLEIELQSPFLNIRWGFVPYHPQNWWVNDNSITVIWRKTF